MHLRLSLIVAVAVSGCLPSAEMPAGTGGGGETGGGSGAGGSGGGEGDGGGLVADETDPTGFWTRVGSDGGVYLAIGVATDTSPYRVIHCQLDAPVQITNGSLQSHSSVVWTTPPSDAPDGSVVEVPTYDLAIEQQVLSLTPTAPSTARYGGQYVPTDSWPDGACGYKRVVDTLIPEPRKLWFDKSRRIGDDRFTNVSVLWADLEGSRVPSSGLCWSARSYPAPSDGVLNGSFLWSQGGGTMSTGTIALRWTRLQPGCNVFVQGVTPQGYAYISVQRPDGTWSSTTGGGSGAPLPEPLPAGETHSQVVAWHDVPNVTATVAMGDCVSSAGPVAPYYQASGPVYPGNQCADITSCSSLLTSSTTGLAHSAVFRLPADTAVPYVVTWSDGVTFRGTYKTYLGGYCGVLKLRRF